MKFKQKLTLAALLALLVAAGLGLYLTSGPPTSTLSSKPTPASNGEVASLNQGYLDTVLRLASTTSTPEEQHAAKAALDAADRELDLQYAYALQLAASEPLPQTPEILSIQDRIARIRNAIQKRQTEIDQIKNAMQRVRGARQDALQNQLDVLQAELNLFQEATADAKDELIQAGGDPQNRLQELKAEHEAASNSADTFKFPAIRGTPALGSLFASWSYWKSVREEGLEIEQARQEALLGAADLSRQHDAIAKRITTEQAQRKALAGHELTPEQIASLIATRDHWHAPSRKSAANPAAQTSTPTAAASPAANGGNPDIALIHEISADQVKLRIIGHQIEVMNALASAYSSWRLLVGSEERAVLHGLIAAGLWIVLMVTVAFFLNRLIEHFFAGLSLERKQKATLQAVLRISVRLIIAIVILMVIFGKPNQLPTVIGLAGAGLAVALQDFLLSFLGWFVLMGRHGIRVGDWVEISPNCSAGVRGEVIEITLIRTVLLETGNWAEPGHLTGRQVALMNMYAVTGYYFNFSTAGQWLWDELQVAMPASQNPYPLIEKIQAMVAKETESFIQLAEREWQGVSHRYGTRTFTAEPTVNLKPTDNGVIAVIRYITRADERTAARFRLNYEIVKLFHDGEKLVPGT